MLSENAKIILDASYKVLSERNSKLMQIYLLPKDLGLQGDDIFPALDELAKLRYIKVADSGRCAEGFIELYTLR